ncbi:unnamed protein product [Amoebophrya sp. A120]|nr:unnamed protein product [Amoebophrya sp. A120]|eukprot:GSA120T00021104001.1
MTSFYHLARSHYMIQQVKLLPDARESFVVLIGFF